MCFIYFLSIFDRKFFCQKLCFDRKNVNFDRKNCQFWQFCLYFGIGEICQNIIFDSYNIIFDSLVSCQNIVLAAIWPVKIYFWQLSTCQKYLFRFSTTFWMSKHIFWQFLTCQKTIFDRVKTVKIYLEIFWQTSPLSKLKFWQN